MNIRTILLCVFLIVTPSANASLIVIPHTAGRDGGLAGNTVASPEDPASAQYINPAGVVGTPANRAMAGALPLNFTAHYSNQTRGYDASSSETALVVNLWHGLGERRGWFVGVGAYGSVGTAFDFASDPGIGQTSRYTGKLSVLDLGFNIGRAITENLRIGFQVAPRFGQHILRTPTPVGNVEFEVDGFGAVASAGLVYEYSDRLSFGLAYRSPGFVDMRGDGKVAENAESVDHKLVTPESIAGGVAYALRPDTTVLAQVKWTDYTDFERGKVEFDKTAVLTQPTISAAKPRFRWGLGVEHEVVPDSCLRLSFTYESWMIERSSMRPYLFDNRELMVMAGYEIRYPSVTVGFMTGYTDLGDRHISASDNTISPGDYGAESDLAAGVRIVWHR